MNFFIVWCDTKGSFQAITAVKRTSVVINSNLGSQIKAHYDIYLKKNTKTSYFKKFCHIAVFSNNPVNLPTVAN